MTYRKPDINDIPGDELAALTAIMRLGNQEVKKAVAEYAYLRAIRAGKRKHDQPLDRNRRILVGARLPREQAWLIARAASIRGVSLYRFCTDALTEKAQEITGISTQNSPFVEGAGQ